MATTTQEALIAELLGDVGLLHDAVKALPGRLESETATLAATAKALHAAGDQYRLAVTAFTEEAKTELKEYVQRKAATVTDQSMQEHRIALRDAARQALQAEVSETIVAVIKTYEASRPKPISHVKVGAIVALASVLSSIMTTTLLLAALKIHI